MKTSFLTLAGASILAVSAFVAPAAADGGSASIGMVLEPPNLDPTAGAAAAIDEVVYANVFEGLTRFGPDGSINPALAESWDVADDGLVYTFHLHDGVTFHDGTTMDADDVVFSFERAMGEDSVNAQKVLFAGIASVEATDPLTVTITLSQPDGNFPFNLAWGDAVIVAPETADTNAINPIGTGPFKFVEWTQGAEIIIDRYDGYWGEPVSLDEAVFKFISDPTAAFAAMMAEDIDAFPNYPSPETLPQLEADPRFTVIRGSTEGETVLAMNNKQPPLDSVLVREAIAHAINREEIIEGAMFGAGTPIGTFFAPHNPDYVDLTGLSNYDPEKSKELLAEAGYADGLDLRLALPPVATYARRGGEIIASQLAAVGIATEITNMEWAQWLEQVFGGGDYDLTIVSHTEPFDIGSFARDDYYFGYQNDEFDAVIAELTNTSDPASRSELLARAQTLLAEDYAAGFLFQLGKSGVANAELHGLWENSPTQANDLTGVYWE